MTAPLPVDIEAANEIVRRFSWSSNVMREGHLISQQVVVAEAIAEALTAVRKDYEEVLADKRRLTRELDIAMHGEEGAAKQASLCDLIEPAKKLRQRAARPDMGPLRKALEPLAVLGVAGRETYKPLDYLNTPYWDCPDDLVLYDDKMGHAITVGDVRCAALLLSEELAQ